MEIRKRVLAGRGAQGAERNLLIIGGADAADERVPVRAVPKPSPAWTSAADGPVRAKSVAGGLGQQLRAAREARGLSHSDVSKVLKITTSQIESLESGKVRNMAPVYATGFVRSYAQFLGEKALGTSPADAVTAYKVEQKISDPDPSQQTKPMFEPLPQTRFGWFRLSMVFGALVLAVAIFATWYFLMDPATDTVSQASDTGYHGAVVALSQDRAGP